MLLQKIFLFLKDKYAISKNEIEDLFDIEQGQSDSIIYDHICIRYESVLNIKFNAMYLEAKKIKNRLLTFLKICLWKKAIDSEIHQDLFMNKLDSYNKKFIVSIKEKNTIYKFRISDIINLWVLALTNVEQLFVKPLEMKNPYTNIEFSKASLYNIYFRMLETGFIIPNLISSHVKYGLDIKMFTIRNYPELKEISILTFMREGNFLDKYEQIVNMLHDYRKVINYHTMSSTCSLSIKKRASRVFSSYLFLYLESRFSCNPLIKNESETRAKEKLKKFLEDEPYFGFNRGDVIRYVPLSERAEQRRRERDVRLSPTPPPGLTPPPIPNTLRRRRRRNAITTLPIEPPAIPPPPPPPTEITSISPNINAIVPSSTSNIRLPPLQLNNFTYSLGSTLDNITRSSNTTRENRVLPTTVSLQSSDTPDYIANLLSTRNRARDLLRQIDDTLNPHETDIEEEEPTEPLPEMETPLSELSTDDEFSNEFSIEVALELENPFEPRNQLNRTPPPEDVSIREPLLQPIRDINTQEIINRISRVIDMQLNVDHEPQETTPETLLETIPETNNEEENNSQSVTNIEPDTEN